LPKKTIEICREFKQQSKIIQTEIFLNSVDQKLVEKPKKIKIIQIKND